MTKQTLIIKPQSRQVTVTGKPTGRRKRFTIIEIWEWFQQREFPRYAKAETHCFKSATRDLLELFGDSPAEEFGVLKLRIVREAMISRGWTRRFVNQSLSRLRLVFKYAASWEMIPGSVLQALNSLGHLKIGESGAPEGTTRSAVPEADLQAVRAVLNSKHRDVFDLLLLTGARPGEILCLTGAMVDCSGDTWRVDLADHKTAKKGKSRFLLFNAEAQTILRRHLCSDSTARIFRIRRDTFGNAVKDACRVAGVPAFTPHWLRHTVATRLVDEVGLEATQQLLGHSGAAMTRHYSRAASKLALQAVGAVAATSKEESPPQVSIHEKLAWNFKEVEEITSLSTDSIRRLVRRREFVLVKVGRQALIESESVRRYFRTRSERVFGTTAITSPRNESARKGWLPEEDALFELMTLEEIVQETGRGIKAVKYRLKFLTTLGLLRPR